MNNKRFSLKISVFHGLKAPEEGTLVGYGAIIEGLELAMPFPAKLSIISEKRRSYEANEWKVFSSRNAFEDTLYKQLIFALKYEGINLLFFKKLFQTISKEEITNIIQGEPTGQYSRKIWFLYEWLMQEQLPLRQVERLVRQKYVEFIRSSSASDAEAAKKLGLAPSNKMTLMKSIHCNSRERTCDCCLAVSLNNCRGLGC